MSEYLDNVVKASADSDKEKKEAPEGYHYMPDGKLMRDDEHAIRSSLDEAGYLVPEEQELADALLDIVEKHGKFDADNTGVWAGYTSAKENAENAEIGVKCGNCVFWEAPNGCKIIVAETEEAGLCRFAVLPDGSVTAALEKDADDPCWEGYIQVGMKEKAGKMVPNCIPQDAAEVDLEDVLFALNKSKSVEQMSPYLITYAINESKDFEDPRAVNYSQIKAVLASCSTPEQAVVDVVSFIELAHRNEVFESALDYTRLLPAGHPRSDFRGITASARKEARADWYCADSSLSEITKKAINEAYSAKLGSVESNFALLKLGALDAAGHLEAVLAAGFRMSRGMRSAMSKALAAVRRRDRKGRFAEEFGRLKGFFGGKDGNFTAVGRMVGATAGKNEFQIEYKGNKNIPDGIYRIPADKTESVGAYLPKRIVDKLPNVKPTFDEKDKDSVIPLDEFLKTRMDSPDGWKAIKNEQGKTTGYQSADGKKILSMEGPDADKAKSIIDNDVPTFGVGENEEFDPAEDIFTLKDSEGNVLAYAQDWATAQKAAIYTDTDPDADEPDMPKKDLDKKDSNGDGVEYGKYSDDVIADGYQFDKESDGKWNREGLIDENTDGYWSVYRGSGPQEGRWFVEAERRDGAVLISEEFKNPEDAFEYAAAGAGSNWDQDWVDEAELDEVSNLAEEYGLDKLDDRSYIADGMADDIYRVDQLPDGKWQVETTYDDGNVSTETFDKAEDAFKAVADEAGVPVLTAPERTPQQADAPDTQAEAVEDYTTDEIALGYAFSKNSDGSYEAPGSTEDGATIVVSEANGKWFVNELGGSGPDNFTDKELGDFDNPAEAFDYANDQLASPNSFDKETAESEREAPAADSPEPPKESLGQSLEKKNTDEDGLPINDMFYVDQAIDDHLENNFITNKDDLVEKLENNWSNGSTAYGDYMTGGAKIFVSENEDATYDVRVEFPNDESITETVDDFSDALDLAATEASIHNTNSVPTALSGSKSFSDLEREMTALETPDQALTFAGRLDEVADALEETRGPKEQTDALRGMAELIREEYGSGDPTQETRFFRMMAEEVPPSSSINPSVDPDTVDAPVVEATGEADGNKEVKSSNDAMTKVMAQMLEAIKGGDVPWRKPFSDDPALAGAALPRNPKTKHIYSGTNAMVLRYLASVRGYDDGRWMTYNQAKELGGQVRKGEKGVFILVPRVKLYTKNKDGSPILDANGQPTQRKFVSFDARAVFNVSQVDGLNLPDDKKNSSLTEAKTPLQAQDFVIERYKKSMEEIGIKVPEIRYTYVGEYGSHNSSPNWSPLMDEITLPTLEQFNSPEEVFDTLMHELAHSTGHASRLDRTELTKDYGNPNGVARAKEELIAEISSAILGQMFGIENTLDNSAAYVQSWLKRLQNNPDEVVFATKEAQKVVDYMLGMHIGDWSPIEGYSVKKSTQGDKN